MTNIRTSPFAFFFIRTCIRKLSLYLTYGFTLFLAQILSMSFLMAILSNNSQRREVRQRFLVKLLSVMIGKDQIFVQYLLGIECRKDW
ncbi:hypothetical protein TorRG33x02_059850 [Trema orientale]|uniref:Uncharacterized protein n=1 Tax=Trema orientale TaxID=63057 RepID=A0A2P5FK37_TREOI|nr:hypothetical protein TorRG33x02_059850 [Trema orientale]